jgi:hypothetical protein
MARWITGFEPEPESEVWLNRTPTAIRAKAQAQPVAKISGTVGSQLHLLGRIFDHVDGLAVPGSKSRLLRQMSSNCSSFIDILHDQAQFLSGTYEASSKHVVGDA